MPVSVSSLLAAAAQSFILLALLTWAALAFRLNSASAGFFLLVGVLLIGSRHPLPVASTAALAATLIYNFFFFHPKRTFTIDDPENWIALVCFLLTSLLANRLLVRERLQAQAADSSRKDLEALYEMSFELLRDAKSIEQIGDSVVRYVERLGARSGGVLLFGASPQQQKALAWTGAPITDEVEEIAAGAGRHGKISEIPSRFGRDVCVPLTVDGKSIACLFVRGPHLKASALESAGNLLAFAIERERFMGERAHVEALQETNRLKTSLLQAVSHDLKSPLTVLSVESEALERLGAAHPLAASHVQTIRDEVARLNRRIDNLLSVARLEAGMVSPRTEPTPPADLFRAARESLPSIRTGRTILTTVHESTPDVLVDPSLALEIVINLVENAHRASPPSEPIELFAMRSSEKPERVWLEVRDRGLGLSREQTNRVRMLEPPEPQSGGLGIELARTLAALSGGSVEWFDRAGGGTIARLDLPSNEMPEDVR